MNLLRTAIAGTMESSDIMVTVEPAKELIIELDSNVINQYGESIKATTIGVAQRLGITGAHIRLVDHGALDCTINARVETAFNRALNTQEAVQ